jgi:addiction module RelE/StbE family toxin
MSSQVVIHPDLASACRKLRAKSPARYDQLKKKIRFLVDNPESGKPLRHPMQGLRRLHIGHSVLIYKFEKKKGLITLVDFAHHDTVY